MPRPPLKGNVKVVYEGNRTWCNPYAHGDDHDRLHLVRAWLDTHAVKAKVSPVGITVVAEFREASDLIGHRQHSFEYLSIKDVISSSVANLNIK